MAAVGRTESLQASIAEFEVSLQDRPTTAVPRLNPNSAAPRVAVWFVLMTHRFRSADRRARESETCADDTLVR
jgi:hypothetical protein